MATRRELLKGTAALPLAVVLANPGLARAAAESTQPVRLTLADGGEVGGALALPEGRGRGGAAPGVRVVRHRNVLARPPDPEGRPR